MKGREVAGRFRVGVLMGGKSVEREVSFNSGRTICDHIDCDRYDVIPLFQRASGTLYVLPLKFLHRGKISDFEHRLDREAQVITWDDLRVLVDFVYIATHGQYAEDGTVQGFLEVLGIPYLGSKVFASACGIDKKFQKHLLRMHHINVPRDVVFYPNQIREWSLDALVGCLEASNISFPCVVKPVGEGSSLGISVVLSSKDLLPALEKASWGEVTRVQPVLVEEKIEGMEFTAIALSSNGDGSTGCRWLPLPITEVVHEKGSLFHDYAQKYMPGRASKITPARCSREEMDKIQNTCIRVSEILGFATFCRIDGFLTSEKKVVIIDPNSLSGMGPASFLFHQAAEIGMNHTHLINYLIDTELKSYGLWDKVLLGQDKGKNVDQKDHIEKKRIIVLLGGDSNEREISLVSGRNVCSKLSPSKYEVLPVFADDQMKLFKLSTRLLLQNSTREIVEQIRSAGSAADDIQIGWSDLPALADFVFIALHGGKGEDGSVQGSLEMLGLPYNGSGVLASALCMNKYRTNEFLRSSGFSVPRSYLLTRNEWIGCKANATQVALVDRIESILGFPLVVKPHDDGCSMYVSMVKSRMAFIDALNDYFATEKSVALIEECVQGMELTCGVIGNQVIEVLPPSQAVATRGILSIEEKFLPGAGENQTPAPIPAHAQLFVQSVIKKVYQALGCEGYARIDCFYQGASQFGEERVVILEINSLPALTPATCLFHQAAEVDIRPMELIDRIVELGYARYQQQSDFASVRGKSSEKEGVE